MQDQLLIKKFEEYVKLLGEELDELTGMAFVHGWKSTRYEAGKKLRQEIRDLGGNVNEG